MNVGATPHPSDSAPRVSVVVRTKNRPDMVRRALADVASQTYTDLEVILVNDGGDALALQAVLGELPSSYRSRIVQIDHEAPQGRAQTANDGIAAARGEFIALHDDDDLWHPEFLEQTVAFLIEEPAAPAVAVPTEVVIEELREGVWVDVGSYLWAPPGDIVILFDLIRHNRVVPIGMLVRSSAYEQIGLYDGTLDAVEDWEFNIRLAMSGTIGYLPGPPLAFWRQRPSATGALGNSVRTESDAHFKFDRIVRERALQRDLSPEGLALLLYLVKVIDERATESEQRFDAIVEHLDEHEKSMQREMREAIGKAERELRREIWESSKHLEQRMSYFSPGRTVTRALRRMLGRRR